MSGSGEAHEQPATSLTNKLTITDLADEEFQDKRVLIRVDFNVPQAEDGSITNTAVRPFMAYFVAKGLTV